jgi:hypothetical protein
MRSRNPQRLTNSVRQRATQCSLLQEPVAVSAANCVKRASWLAHYASSAREPRQRHAGAPCVTTISFGRAALDATGAELRDHRETEPATPPFGIGPPRSYDGWYPVPNVRVFGFVFRLILVVPPESLVRPWYGSGFGSAHEA